MPGAALQRAAVQDAALMDALTDSFASELAIVLDLLTARIRSLVRTLETDTTGRIVATSQNLARALRMRADLMSVLTQAGYADLAMRATDEALDRLAAQILRSGRVEMTAFDLDALVALKEIRFAELLQVGEDVAVQLWRVTVDGVLGLRPVIDLVDDIADLLDISARHARTVYDTAVSTFSRQVGQIGTTGEPGEAFLYVGPDDDKTREFCKDHVDRVYSRGVIDEMDNGQLPNVMLTGGGWNCRHQFKRVSALDQDLLDLVDTDVRYQDRNNPDAARATSVSIELTDEEQKAVEGYTFGGQWKQLNEALREGRPLDDQQQEMVRQLDSAIAKAPKLPSGTTLYRGVNFGQQGMPSGAETAAMSAEQREQAVRRSIANWAEDTYKPGDTFQLGGYQSTSRELQPALDASLSRKSPGVVFEISARTGLDLTGIGSKAVDDEAEVLLSRFTTYRVEGVEKNRVMENAAGDEVIRTVIRVTQIFGGR